MQVLDYNGYVEQQFKCEARCFGGSAIRVPEAGPFPDVGHLKSLKDGFNEYVLELPNGCKIIAHESGEVFLQEEGKQPMKVRNKDALQNLLVK